MRATRVLSFFLAGGLIVPMIVLADSSSSSSSSSVSSSSSSVSSSSSSSRQSSSSSAPDSSKGRRGRGLAPATAECIQMAVDAREQSVLTAVTSYTTTIVSAFQKKKSDLHLAWAITDASARKAAVKNAWTVFAQSKRSARQTYKKARQTTWSTFRKAAKLCNESMSDESYKANEDL